MPQSVLKVISPYNRRLHIISAAMKEYTALHRALTGERRPSGPARVIATTAASWGLVGAQRVRPAPTVRGTIPFATKRVSHIARERELCAA